MKILIIRLTSMGDIIHSMYVLQFIKKQLPKAKIHWLVDDIFVDILRHNPDIDKIHTIALRKKKGLFSGFKEIRKTTGILTKEGFDLIIDMQGLLKTGFITSLIKGKKIGFDRKSAREALASFFYDRKIFIPYEKNIYKRNLELVLKALDLKKPTTKESIADQYLFFSDEAGKKASKTIDSREKNILLIPAASTGERIISTRMYRKLIKGLPGKKFISYGNDKELKTAEKIAKDLKNTVILPKLDLDTLKALISRCDLVIGPDTGPSNIPFAVNTASITIYWDGAKNPSLRNSIKTDKNISFSFSDLRDFDENIILNASSRLLKS